MLGMPTTMLGEVLVKWVEGLQTRLPMCVGGAILGPIRFKAKQRERYRQVLPWAIRYFSAELGARENFRDNATMSRSRKIVALSLIIRKFCVVVVAKKNCR